MLTIKDINHVEAKFANMRKSQVFMVYPKQTDDQNHLILQSAGRIIRVDLTTGDFRINPKNVEYPVFMLLQLHDVIKGKLTKEQLEVLQSLKVGSGPVQLT